MMHDLKSIRTRPGFISLIGVLLIGAVALAVSVTLLLLGLNDSRSSLAYQQSEQSAAFADACLEEALQQIRSSASFVGSNSLAFTNGSCTYTVTSQGGQSRTLISTGISSTSTRRVSATLNQLSPTMNITSWQEVASF